jgi:hypothetical protein
MCFHRPRDASSAFFFFKYWCWGSATLPHLAPTQTTNRFIRPVDVLRLQLRRRLKCLDHRALVLVQVLVGVIVGCDLVRTHDLSTRGIARTLEQLMGMAGRVWMDTKDVPQLPWWSDIASLCTCARHSRPCG